MSHSQCRWISLTLASPPLTAANLGLLIAEEEEDSSMSTSSCMLCVDKVEESMTTSSLSWTISFLVFLETRDGALKASMADILVLWSVKREWRSSTKIEEKKSFLARPTAANQLFLAAVVVLVHHTSATAICMRYISMDTVFNKRLFLCLIHMYIIKIHLITIKYISWWNNILYMIKDNDISCFHSFPLWLFLTFLTTCSNMTCY